MTNEDFTVTRSLAVEEKIGVRIRNLRKANRLTQDELAARTGLDQGKISHYENGLDNLSVIHLTLIAKALKVSPAYFFQESSSEEELADLVDGLVPSLRGVIKKLALVLIEIQERALVSAKIYIQDNVFESVEINYDFIADMELTSRRAWHLATSLGSVIDLHLDFVRLAEERQKYGR